MKYFGILLIILVILGLYGCSAKNEIDGGVVTRINSKAPKKIVSRDIETFSTEFYIRDAVDFDRAGAYSYKITKKENGAFALESAGMYSHTMELSAAQVMGVQEIFEKYRLVKNNGVHKVTAGLPAEVQPMSLSITYASGETFEYCVNGDPEAEWTLAFRNYFDSLFTEAGFTDAKPSEKAYEVTDFKFKFMDGAYSRRYGYYTDDQGKDCVQSYAYNQDSKDSVLKTARITEDFLTRLSEQIRTLNLDVCNRQFARDSGETACLEIHISYANGRYIHGKYAEGQIPDEWKAAKEPLTQFLDEYIEENEL